MGPPRPKDDGRGFETTPSLFHFKAVLRREKTPQEVHRDDRQQHAHAEVKRATKLKGKYRVLYAGPPWKPHYSLLPAFASLPSK